MGTNYVIVVSVLEGKNFPVRHDRYLVVEAKFDGEVMSTDPAPHVMRPHFSTELAWEVDKKGLQMHRLQRSPIKLNTCKNFPVRHDRYLVVEAKFDGEVMSTDPAPHVMRPHFSTELAWEVDKKGLQMHRLQRSPIKLQWYALDLDSPKKETIGYMILDIRLAQEKLQSPKWYPMLNSKYQKEKPEVLLCLYLERVAEDVSKRNSIAEDGGRKSSSARAPVVQRAKSQGGTPQNGARLKPVLLSHAGCYQIGPPEFCSQKFVFSVTLAFAANLNKLAPPAMLKSSKGFYFYYSLFDNDVMTEKFPSLSNPDFLAERASVRISSSPKVLAEYFEEHPSLEIILCCGDVSLGSGQIPLEPFSCVNRHNIDEEPLCIEGSVQISATEKTSRLGGDDLSPFVGVTVVLQVDKPEEQNEDAKDSTPVKEENEGKNPQPFQAHPKCNQNNKCFEKTNVKSSDVQENQRDPQKEYQLHKESNHSLVNGSGDPDVIPCNHSADSTPPGNGDITGRPASIPVQGDGSARHFSFNLDLRNFQATRLAHPIHLFIRYSYPFFGTTTSMVTHPDMEVHPKSQVSIPHGYCAFNFATTFALLKSTFWETPLLLEVLHRKKGSQEQPVGTARVNLFQVLDAPAQSTTVEKKQGMCRMCSCKVVVTSPEGYEIGEIYAAMTLIDFGPTSVLCDRHSNQPNIPCFPQAQNFTPHFEIPLLRQNGLTQDERLQAALELELWQERQREIFRAQLKDKEMQYLSVLTTEWKQRDMERELMLQRKLQECQKLEVKLNATLKDAEIKEKQLASQDAELSARLQEINRQQEQKQRDTKNRMDALKMEFNELLTLERLKVEDLQKQNSSLVRQIKELEREVQEQRESLKSKINKDPEDLNLRTEVNILSMEKAELQHKLELAIASKQKYKVQWGQTVRQVSGLQQKLHMMERVELARRDEEILALRRKLLAAEERSISRMDEEIRGMVQEKVESLKSVVSPENGKIPERRPPSVTSDVRMTPTGDVGPHLDSNATEAKPNANPGAKLSPYKPNGEMTPDDADCVAESPSKPIRDSSDMNGNTTSNVHVRQLLAKKDTLLRAGMYSEQDRLIRDLNVHIDKAKMATK
ncbi:centrosomal protein of 120 kDa-like [Uloborus diversus]|uniref:centrosomal protein of 120 kDa-like n=1 Tax=Uloborus diversus TaxID=327109 RepID=UPI002409149C|nr:centrosomal protein of 120 kDa-like [Uloborus diversus]